MLHRQGLDHRVRLHDCLAGALSNREMSVQHVRTSFTAVCLHTLCASAGEHEPHCFWFLTGVTASRPRAKP